jgi:hypothetical protein
MEGLALVRRNLRIFSFIGETVRRMATTESRLNLSGVAVAFIGNSAHDKRNDR